MIQFKGFCVLLKSKFDKGLNRLLKHNTSDKKTTQFLLIPEEKLFIFKPDDTEKKSTIFTRAHKKTGVLMISFIMAMQPTEALAKEQGKFRAALHVAKEQGARPMMGFETIKSYVTYIQQRFGQQLLLILSLVCAFIISTGFGFYFRSGYITQQLSATNALHQLKTEQNLRAAAAADARKSDMLRTMFESKYTQCKFDTLNWREKLDSERMASLKTYKENIELKHRLSQAEKKNIKTPQAIKGPKQSPNKTTD